jgi:hypothetical protein
MLNILLKRTKERKRTISNPQPPHRIPFHPAHKSKQRPRTHSPSPTKRRPNTNIFVTTRLDRTNLAGAALVAILAVAQSRAGSLSVGAVARALSRASADASAAGSAGGEGHAGLAGAGGAGAGAVFADAGCALGEGLISWDILLHRAVEGGRWGRVEGNFGRLLVGNR